MLGLGLVVGNRCHGDGGEAEAGGGVAAELADADFGDVVGEGGEGVFCGLIHEIRVRHAAGGGADDGVEKCIGRDVFLVEESTFFGGAGFIGDADVLGDLAGGGDKVGEGAVRKDDEALGDGLEKLARDEF